MSNCPVRMARPLTCASMQKLVTDALQVGFTQPLIVHGAYTPTAVISVVQGLTKD